MSRMETIAEHLQGQVELYHASDSDMSESSYQSYQPPDGFRGSRQSSINTEPLTLDSEEIGIAKGEAEHVLESVAPEEAFDIFTKDLQVKNGEAVTEAAMTKKMGNHSGKNTQVKNKELVRGGEITRKMSGPFENLVQKAAEIIQANEKLAQARTKIPGASKEQVSDGEQSVQ